MAQPPYRNGDRRRERDDSERWFEDWQQPRRHGVPKHEWRSSRARGVMERRMKRLAEDCVETVSGVSQVHNRLRIEDSTAQRSQGSQAQQGGGSLGSVRQSSGRAV